MPVLRQLLRVELAALFALLVVAGGMALYGAAMTTLYDESLFDAATSAQLAFVYTLAIGVLPVAVIGAPGYVVLLRKRLARWPAVLALGVLPGVLALAIDVTLASWAVPCGAVVALLTHAMCRGLGRDAPAAPPVDPP